MTEKLTDIFRPESSYRAFFLSIATFALGYGLYKGILDNYLAQVAGMSEFDKGVSEFFREMPGLLLIVVLVFLYKYTAERIFQIGAVIMVAGLVMQTVISPVKVLIIIAIFIRQQAYIFVQVNGYLFGKGPGQFLCPGPSGLLFFCKNLKHFLCLPTLSTLPLLCFQRRPPEDLSSSRTGRG